MFGIIDLDEFPFSGGLSIARLKIDSVDNFFMAMLYCFLDFW
jgi:hypothetical protein